MTVSVIVEQQHNFIMQNIISGFIGALKSKWDNGVNTKIVDDGRQVNSIKLITDIFDFE